MLVRFEAALRIILVAAVLTASVLYTLAYTLSPLDLLRAHLLWLARFVVFPIASIVLLLYGVLRALSRLGWKLDWNVIAGYTVAKPFIRAPRQA